MENIDRGKITEKSREKRKEKSRGKILGSCLVPLASTAFSLISLSPLGHSALLAQPAPAQPAPMDREQEREVSPFYMPDYLKQHLGSYQGLAAAGAGYSFYSALWELDMLYNYSPASVAGRELHAISLRNSINPYSFTVSSAISDIEIRPLYLGAFFLFALSEDLDYLLPEGYPNGYYPPSAFHFGLHLGFEVIFLKQFYRFRKWSFALEYAIHDVGISAFFNEGYLPIEDLLSWGFGFKFYLSNE